MDQQPYRVPMRLLDGDPSMRRLIMTWPNVERAEGWRETRNGRNAVIRLWSAISGVPQFEIRHLWLKLFNNRFIDDDGTVPDAVMNYINIIETPLLSSAEMKRRASRSGYG
jgi:hypothetical protein